MARHEHTCDECERDYLCRLDERCPDAEENDLTCEDCEMGLTEDDDG